MYVCIYEMEVVHEHDFNKRKSLQFIPNSCDIETSLFRLQTISFKAALKK